MSKTGKSVDFTKEVSSEREDLLPVKLLIWHVFHLGRSEHFGKQSEDTSDCNQLHAPHMLTLFCLRVNF
jgi:hypothetical protein